MGKFQNRFLFLCVVLMPFQLLHAQNRVIDSLQRIISEGNNDRRTNLALNDIAVEYARVDMLRSAGYLHQSIRLASQLHEDVLLSNAYSQMVSLNTDLGRKDSAQFYLQLLKELASGNAPDIIRANYNQAGGLYYKKNGDYKSALPYMIRYLNDNIAVDAKQNTINSKTAVAGSLLNVGNTYMNMGDYRNALEYHLKALKDFEGINNKRGIAFCNQSISSDFIKLGQYKAAIPYLNSAMAQKKELNDKRGVAISSEDYGAVYLGLGDYEKAIQSFNDALLSFHELKLIPDEAKTNSELAKVYVLKNDETAARHYFENARTLARQLNDSVLLNTIDAEVVALQSSLGQQKADEQKLMASMRSSIEMQDKEKEMASYRYLADFYTERKQYDKALEYTNKLHSVTDSVQSNDLQVEIRKLEKQYDLEKKENEIILLKKDRQIYLSDLQKQRAFRIGAGIFLIMAILIGFLMINRYRIVQRTKRLIEIEKMRTNIARDLHDDIGSTLSSINILSKVALQKQGEDVSLMGANLQKIRNHSGAIMESMSDIVWAINPMHDDFKQIIFRMKEFGTELLESMQISYTFQEKGDFSAIRLDVSKRKDFYLLYKEAVNNAVKYSQCKQLDILIQEQAGTLSFKVSDNGIGFDETAVRMGNGLTNMRERAAAMGAMIKITSLPGKGTEIGFSLPVT